MHASEGHDDQPSADGIQQSSGDETDASVDDRSFIYPGVFGSSSPLPPLTAAADDWQPPELHKRSAGDADLPTADVDAARSAAKEPENRIASSNSSDSSADSSTDSSSSSSSHPSANAGTGSGMPAASIALFGLTYSITPSAKAHSNVVASTSLPDSSAAGAQAEAAPATEVKSKVLPAAAAADSKVASNGPASHNRVSGRFSSGEVDGVSLAADVLAAGSATQPGTAGTAMAAGSTAGAAGGWPASGVPATTAAVEAAKPAASKPPVADGGLKGPPLVHKLRRKGQLAESKEASEPAATASAAGTSVCAVGPQAMKAARRSPRAAPLLSVFDLPVFRRKEAAAEAEAEQQPETPARMSKATSRSDAERVAHHNISEGLDLFRATSPESEDKISPPSQSPPAASSQPQTKQGLTPQQRRFPSAQKLLAAEYRASAPALSPPLVAWEREDGCVLTDPQLRALSWPQSQQQQQLGLPDRASLHGPTDGGSQAAASRAAAAAPALFEMTDADTTTAWPALPPQHADNTDRETASRRERDAVPGTLPAEPTYTAVPNSSGQPTVAFPPMSSGSAGKRPLSPAPPQVRENELRTLSAGFYS